MGAISAIGRLVLYLHECAEINNGVTPRAAAFILALREGIVSFMGEGITVEAAAGLEIRSGRAHSKEARSIRRAALARLRNYNVLLGAVDALGYTPQLVRAALAYHWTRLGREEAGADGNCVYIDLFSAMSQSPLDVRRVCAMLAAGYSSQEIGSRLGVNGSRAVGGAVARLGRILEGRDAPKTT